MSKSVSIGPSMRVKGIVLDCGNVHDLGDFYEKLLGWQRLNVGDGWAAVQEPGDGLVLAFQHVEGYQPPVWPWQKGIQGQMLHFDLFVEDLQKAVAHAVDCGARVCEVQYYDTSVTLLDPAGHPFCLDADPL